MDDNNSIVENINEPADKTDSSLLRVRREQYFVGPLPPPNILKQYDDVVPGAANRIITVFENENEHRHGLERKIVKTESRDSLLGVVSAFILCIVALIGCIFLISSGHEVYGIILGGFGLTGLATTFIVGRNSENKPPGQSDANAE
jgi:uncharacterized membrane protein